MNVYSAAALNVADAISDPMMPELDPSVLDFRPIDIDFGSKKDDPLHWTSQSLLEPLSTAPVHAVPEDRRDEDDMHIELELDLGDDETPSIELGRRDQGPIRSIEDDLISDDDKFSNLKNQADYPGHDDLIRTRLSSEVPSVAADIVIPSLENDVVLMDNGQDFEFRINEDTTVPVITTPIVNDLRSPRDSQSPLSSVRSSVVREFDAMLFDEGETSIHQAHKAKKRKILQADADTMISSSQIRQQQEDRSAILKPASLLSRDPVLLNLLTMQRNGDFVSSIMGNGRAKGWAPELRGVLSIEVIRNSGKLKRKRADDVANVKTGDKQMDMAEGPLLEIPADDEPALLNEDVSAGENITFPQQSEIIDLPAGINSDSVLENPNAENEHHQQDQTDDEEGPSPARDMFDETPAPLLHPEDQGVVSVGTQHAVHLLRDRFASLSISETTSKQTKATISFQEMLPEATTSKADATKMFFEVRVLATKDAVKVTQPQDELGGLIRIRGKRGLWGAWAEKEAGGEIAEQEGGSNLVATL